MVELFLWIRSLDVNEVPSGCGWFLTCMSLDHEGSAERRSGALNLQYFNIQSRLAIFCTTVVHVHSSTWSLTATSKKLDLDSILLYVLGLLSGPGMTHLRKIIRGAGASIYHSWWCIGTSVIPVIECLRGPVICMFSLDPQIPHKLVLPDILSPPAQRVPP